MFKTLFIMSLFFAAVLSQNWQLQGTWYYAGTIEAGSGTCVKPNSTTIMIASGANSSTNSSRLLQDQETPVLLPQQPNSSNTSTPTNQTVTNTTTPSNETEATNNNTVANQTAPVNSTDNTSAPSNSTPSATLGPQMFSLDFEDGTSFNITLDEATWIGLLGFAEHVGTAGSNSSFSTVFPPEAETVNNSTANATNSTTTPTNESESANNATNTTVPPAANATNTTNGSRLLQQNYLRKGRMVQQLGGPADSTNATNATNSTTPPTNESEVPANTTAANSTANTTNSTAAPFVPTYNTEGIMLNYWPQNGSLVIFPTAGGCGLIFTQQAANSSNSTAANSTDNSTAPVNNTANSTANTTAPVNSTDNSTNVTSTPANSSQTDQVPADSENANNTASQIPVGFPVPVPGFDNEVPANGSSNSSNSSNSSSEGEFGPGGAWLLVDTWNYANNGTCCLPTNNSIYVNIDGENVSIMLSFGSDCQNIFSNPDVTWKEGFQGYGFIDGNHDGVWFHDNNSWALFYGGCASYYSRNGQESVTGLQNVSSVGGNNSTNGNTTGTNMTNATNQTGTPSGNNGNNYVLSLFTVVFGWMIINNF